MSNEARIFDHVEETRDLSFNVQWDITERLHTSFDVQYIKAKTNNYDILVAANTFARVDYTTDSDGTPQVALSAAPNVNYASGFLANPHNYWMQFIQDHWEDNDADEKAARADVEYDLGQRRLAQLAEGRRALRRSRAEGSLLDLQLGADRAVLELQRPGVQRRQHDAGAVSGGLRQSRARSTAIPRASGKPRLSEPLQRQRLPELARWCF